MIQIFKCQPFGDVTTNLAWLVARQVHEHFSATSYHSSVIAGIFEWNVNGTRSFVLWSYGGSGGGGKFPPLRRKTFVPDPAAGEECRKGAPAPVYTPHAICTLTNAKPIIIAAQTLKRCSINRKWLSPNFYFRLELRAIYHSERYEGGALGHAGRWYYSAITWGKMEDLRASKCVHVMAFPLVSRWIIRRYYISKFFNVSSPLCLTLPQWPEILFVTIELRSVPRDLIFY